MSDDSTTKTPEEVAKTWRERATGAAFKAWLDAGQHLPPFLRDFHAQKDVFKTVGNIQDDLHPVSWVAGHIYVIDGFLRFMARCGWTLQRSRARWDFHDVHEEIEKRKTAEVDATKALLAHKEAERKEHEGLALAVAAAHEYEISKKASRKLGEP